LGVHPRLATAGFDLNDRHEVVEMVREKIISGIHRPT